jgi:hypothetical protein
VPFDISAKLRGRSGRLTAASERKKAKKTAHDNRQTRRLRDAGRSLLDIGSNISSARVFQDSGTRQILSGKDTETAAIVESVPARHWRMTVRFSGSMV